MRDLMAVARELQRGSQTHPTHPRRKPPRKPGKRVGLLVGLVVFACGVSLGALPFVFGWSGQTPRGVSHEHALGFAHDPSTQPNRVGTLMVWLTGSSANGIEAIRSFGTRAPELRADATAALQRIRTAVSKGKVDRRNARRYPTGVTYNDALSALEDVPANPSAARDCLEVIVYNIEEAALLFASKASMNGLPGAQARAASLKLLSKLDQ